jgi:Mu-like prophage protein gp29
MNFDFFNLFKPKTKPVTLITQPENEPIIRPEISPSNILFAKSQMDAGYYKDIYALFQRLIADNDNLAGCIDIRKEAAKACEYRFATELSTKQEEFFENLLSDFLSDLISQSIDLKLQGILFRQVHYKFQDNLYFLDRFESYKNLDMRLKNKKISLYIEDKEIALPELNFVFLHKDNSVLESLLKYYCFFSFAINNWVQYTESYGKPVRIGKYQPGSSPKEINILKQMVASLGSDLAAVIPDNTLIEFVESQQKSASSSLYKDLANFLEDRETRRILGETMSTKEAQNAGFAQSKVQDLVRKDVLAGDLADASRYVSWFLSRFNRINFADQPVRIELFPPKTVDLSQRINIDKQLNNIIDIDPDYFYGTYNIPSPEGGMKIKQTPAPITNSTLFPLVREAPERAMGFPNLTNILNRTYSNTSKAAAALKKNSKN